MNNPLVQPDPGLFIWTIFTFLVLLVLLAKFAWKPLLAFLASRQETIKKSLENAQTAKKELERLQQESAQIIRKAHGEAESIVSEKLVGCRKSSGRDEAESQDGSRCDRQGKPASDRTRNRPSAAANPKRGRRSVDRNRIKVIQRNVSKEDNSRLIEDTLKQIDSGRSN